MRLTVGIDFDRGSWPGPLGRPGDGRGATVGEAWVGPGGLLSILETRLGLGGPVQPAALRAAGLVPEVVGTEGFWSRSAEHNPLATARTLLGWRDRLWLQGWRGEPLAGRLTALAAVTRSAEAGVPDRLEAVARQAGSLGGAIERLQLHEVRKVWPPLWRRVFERLEAGGVEIGGSNPAEAMAGGDLGIAHGVLRGAGSGTIGSGANEVLRCDGSLQLLRPHGPMRAAEEVAAWLAAVATAGNLEGTVVIDGDPLLDRALHAHGLPTTGAAPRQAQGALLQILPLVLALGWDPADPQRALELLTLPVTPVPWEVRRRLADALDQWPAVGSEDWNLGLEEGLATIEDEPRRQATQQRLVTLLGPAVPRSTYYPTTEVARRTKAVRRWLAARQATDDEGKHPWDGTMAQCGTLLALIEASGLDSLSAPQLDRFVDQATRTVSEAAPYAPEAGLTRVGLPGGIVGPARRVIWWGFDLESAQRSAPWFLSAGENQALEAAGIPAPDLGSEAVALAGRWRRPVLAAEKTCLLVCPATDESGEDGYPHPLWDELTGLMGEEATRGLTVTEPVFEVPPARISVPFLELPTPRREWSVDPAKVPQRQRESLSGLSTLLGCSLKWALQYPGSLWAGRSNQVAGEAAFLGSLLHEIVERVLVEEPASPQAAKDRALELFDDLGPRLVAPFYLPGSDATRSHARRMAGEGARRLTEILAADGRHVVSTEAWHHREAFGGEIGGRLDLVVGDPPGIVDLKLGSGGYRRKELKNGISGLAVYGYALKEAGAPFPPYGYFIFTEQALLATDRHYFPNAEHVDGPGAEETWRAWVKAMIGQRAELDRGRLEAPGNPDATGQIHPDEDAIVDGRVQLAAPCRFCDFKVLCGLFFGEMEG